MLAFCPSRKFAKSVLLIFGIIFSTTPFLFPVFLVAYPLCVWFDKLALYRRVDHFIFELHVRLVLFVYQYFGGTQVAFYGDAEDVFYRKENVLYIGNHQTGVDWIMAAFISVRGGIIHQLRYVMKHSLTWMPFYGWVCYLHRCIFVHRQNFNQKEMENDLEELKGLPFWLVIFPEGTRYDPDSSQQKEKCEAYAKENGLPVLRHLLTPRAKGVATILRHLRDEINAVYDVTIFYERSIDLSGKRVKSPEFLEYFWINNNRVHVHIRRIPTSSIPSKEEEIKKWLYDAFVHKDEIMDAFVRQQRGQSTSTDAFLLRRNKMIQTKGSTMDLLPSFLFWVFLFLLFVWNSTIKTLYVLTVVAMFVMALLWNLLQKKSTKLS